MEAQTCVKGDTTGRTSEMQVCSSDEALLAPVRNNDVGVIEHTSPLPPVTKTLVSAVSSSSDVASAGGAQKNFETPWIPRLMTLLPNYLSLPLPIFTFTLELLAT